MAHASAFFFKDVLDFDEKAKIKFLKPEVGPLFEMVIEELTKLNDFTEKEEKIETILKSIVEKTIGGKMGIANC